MNSSYKTLFFSNPLVCSILFASPVMPDDDIPFNFDMVSFLISLIDNEVSKSLSRVRLTYSPINESKPKSPKLVSALTDEGSFTPTTDEYNGKKPQCQNSS